MSIPENLRNLLHTLDVENNTSESTCCPRRIARFLREKHDQTKYGENREYGWNLHKLPNAIRDIPKNESIVCNHNDVTTIKITQTNADIDVDWKVIMKLATEPIFHVSNAPTGRSFNASHTVQYQHGSVNPNTRTIVTSPCGTFANPKWTWRVDLTSIPGYIATPYEGIITPSDIKNVQNIQFALSIAPTPPPSLIYDTIEVTHKKKTVRMTGSIDATKTYPDSYYGDRIDPNDPTSTCRAQFQSMIGGTIWEVTWDGVYLGSVPIPGAIVPEDGNGITDPTLVSDEDWNKLDGHSWEFVWVPRYA